MRVYYYHQYIHYAFCLLNFVMNDTWNHQKQTWNLLSNLSRQVKKCKLYISNNKLHYVAWAVNYNIFMVDSLWLTNIPVCVLGLFLRAQQVIRSWNKVTSQIFMSLAGWRRENVKQGLPSWCINTKVLVEHYPLVLALWHVTQHSCLDSVSVASGWFKDSDSRS